MNPRTLLPFLCIAALGSCPASAVRVVQAGNPAFRYAGRIDFSKPAGPVLIWEGTTVTVDFKGDQASVRFGKVTDQVFFNATLDGATSVLAPKSGDAPQLIALDPKGPGRHHLVLYKRSEASAGSAQFEGLELADKAAVFAPALPTYRLRMEFIGDSITAGACNEDGPSDQWESRRTHNAAKSWAALAANALSADYENNSVSGIGISEGWDDVLIRQVWDRVYPTASSPKADLTSWRPDLILVLLGENDTSFTAAHGRPFPADFAASYESLIRAVRGANPTAQIVLLRGGMGGGHNNADLAKAWGEAVAALESSDARVSHFVFNHWSVNHPRVADDQAMADEVVGWLRAQPFAAAWVRQHT